MKKAVLAIILAIILTGAGLCCFRSVEVNAARGIQTDTVAAENARAGDK